LSQFTNLNIVDQSKRDSLSINTPNLPGNENELITEGEENLSDIDDVAESVKNEAKKLETRISESTNINDPASNKIPKSYPSSIGNPYKVEFKNKNNIRKDRRASPSPINENTIP
jgi:hypothetical protein